MTPPTRVALALGCGGARGYAHIGAIQVIEERGMEIVGVAGSSMGALVGGAFAAGALGHLTDWATGMTQREVVRLLDMSHHAPGLVVADRFLDRFRGMTGDTLIEDLPVAYTAVATDLLAHKSVWFQRGPLDVAVRASISIPGVFTPVMLDGRLLADGGLVDPLPVAPVAAVAADLTIAVSLGGPRTQVGNGQDVAGDPSSREWLDRLRRRGDRLLESDLARSLRRHTERTEAVETTSSPRGDTSKPSLDGRFGTLPAGLGLLDVMNLSLDTVEDVLIAYRLAGYPPDIVITVPKDACATMEFHRADEMISLGRTLTGEALDRAGIGAA